MNSNMTGFDPSIVHNAINGVIRAYTRLNGAINQKTQSDFVQGMSDEWACNQAQTFFSSVKEVFDRLINASNSTFQSVVDSMNSAGQTWASQTDSEYSSVSFETQPSVIDTSCILENIGGVRGIDVSSANQTANSLIVIAGEASSALQSAVSAVESAGFVGGSQQANLTASLNSIRSNIDQSVTGITEDLKKAISDTVTQYGDTAGKVAQAFAGGSGQ